MWIVLIYKLYQLDWTYALSPAIQGAANPILSSWGSISCPRTHRWTRMKRDFNCNLSGMENRLYILSHSCPKQTEIEDLVEWEKMLDHCSGYICCFALLKQRCRCVGPDWDISIVTTYIVVVSAFILLELQQSRQTSKITISPEKKHKECLPCNSMPDLSCFCLITATFNRVPVPRILVKASFSQLVYCAFPFLFFLFIKNRKVALRE